MRFGDVIYYACQMILGMTSLVAFVCTVMYIIATIMGALLA